MKKVPLPEIATVTPQQNPKPRSPKKVEKYSKPLNSEIVVRHFPSKVYVQKKPSSSKHERSASISSFVDLPVVRMIGTKSFTPKRPVSTETSPRSKRDNMKEIDFNYLEVVRSSESGESITDDDDLDLLNVQKKISRTEKMLHETAERLKNINFNKETELLRNLENPNYGKILETVDKVKYEERMASLDEKLEPRKLEENTKTIEPRGAQQLMALMSETLKAFDFKDD